MKAMSIIGIILSVVGVLAGIASTNTPDDAPQAGGAITIIVSLYFLAFSIVATVGAFKKTVTP